MVTHLTGASDDTTHGQTGTGNAYPFKLACRQHRLDVVEHFLRALETRQRKPVDQDPEHCQYDLMEAYDEVVRRP